MAKQTRAENKIKELQNTIEYQSKMIKQNEKEIESAKKNMHAAMENYGKMIQVVSHLNKAMGLSFPDVG